MKTRAIITATVLSCAGCVSEEDRPGLGRTQGAASHLWTDGYDKSDKSDAGSKDDDPPSDGCWLTGGGTVRDGKTRPLFSFGGNVKPGCSATAGDGGHWNHVDHAGGLHFKGTSIQVVGCSNLDGIPAGSKSPATPFNVIDFAGTGTLAGLEGSDGPVAVSFVARAEDRSEPGSKGASSQVLVDRYFLHVYGDPNDPDGSTLLLVDGDGDPATIDPVAIGTGNMQIHSTGCESD